MAQDGGFQVGFVVALAQAEEVEEVRVLEHQGGGTAGVGRCDGHGQCVRLWRLGAGDNAALEGLAVDLVAEFTHAPALQRGLLGVVQAGLCRLER